MAPLHNPWYNLKNWNFKVVPAVQPQSGLYQRLYQFFSFLLVQPVQRYNLFIIRVYRDQKYA